LNFPAVFLKKRRAIIIADLHLGLEQELQQAGIKIPSQAEKFQNIIEKLINETKAKLLIILGDIKHKVPGISFKEEIAIQKILNNLVERVKIIITVGNHDSQLKEIVPREVKIYSSRGFRVGKYGFFHGHAWPLKELMRCDYLFMGHLHPNIEFRDKFGLRFIEQVWVKTKLDREKIKEKYGIEKTGGLNLFVLPAFNKLLGGLVLNRPEQEEYFGPLLKDKILDLEKAGIYLLDGTFLGNIKNL
jgi:putative SbcD/Mre11-related phosphoesterase